MKKKLMNYVIAVISTIIGFLGYYQNIEVLSIMFLTIHFTQSKKSSFDEYYNFIGVASFAFLGFIFALLCDLPLIKTMIVAICYFDAFMLLGIPLTHACVFIKEGIVSCYNGDENSEHIFVIIYNKIPRIIRGEVLAFLGLLCFLLVVFLFSLNDLSILKKVYSFVRLLSELAFYFVAIKLIYLIYALIKGKKFNNLKVQSIWFILLLIISLPHIPRLFGYGNTQIGSYYEKTEYTENYVVFMSREPQTKKQRKVYNLTSQISRYEDYLYTDTTTNHITGDQTDEDITTFCYHIEKLYFNNGGYLNFDEQESDYTILVPNKECSVRDNKGDSYYITLTRTKAPK